MVTLTRTYTIIANCHNFSRRWSHTFNVSVTDVFCFTSAGPNNNIYTRSVVIITSVPPTIDPKRGWKSVTTKLYVTLIFSLAAPTSASNTFNMYTPGSWSGAVHIMDVAVADVMSQCLLPIVTVKLPFDLYPVPFIVTTVPPATSRFTGWTWLMLRSILS